MKRSAFTMMELVFVIVILGILASVAVPRLTATRTDAQITRGIADISAIRSSIITKRSENLLTGNASYP
ncbi:MAG: type II secretion system GspH family protein, partial [Campylobacteraceae bacterium]|nr:type II secretion system GspH family protein [Campylobacteraceae bacterium]